MQAVSASYNAYPDKRRCGMRVSFALVDTTAAADASPVASESSALSQLAQTHNNINYMGQKIGTFETDGCPLDGTFVAAPDSVTGIETGWWSNLSGSDGVFASPPTLTFTFDDLHSSYGFTVIFDALADWYAKEYIIAAYDASDVLIDSETVNPTSAISAVIMPAADYKKIIVTFNSTLKGYQRVRVAEVVFGIIEAFDPSNIKDASVLHEIIPNGASAPSSELVFTFDNLDRKYNMLSPNSLYAYLQTGQPIDVDLGVGEIDPEYVNMGRFYFTKSESDDDAMTAKLTANDMMFQLEKTKCNIGTTGTWTVSAAVAAVISDSGKTITTVIPAAVGARVISKAIPQGTTHREALRMIAQAGQATLIFNREDELELMEIAVGTPVDTLDKTNMENNAKITITDMINVVALSVNDEYAETDTVYTASDIGTGETAQTLSVTNPLGTQATADWLLTMAKHRIVYTLAGRGNPAAEVGDTITVYDAYGVNGDCAKTKQQFAFNGGLTVDTKGWA